MTQPERSEVDWSLLFAVDCALRQLEAALPPWVRITIEVDTDAKHPLVLEYSSEAPAEELIHFLHTAAPLKREPRQTSPRSIVWDDPPEAS